MKFVCDKCNTRYSIADERVHGRVLKIRCKACNNVITVREDHPLPAPPPVASSLEDALSNFQRDDEQTRVSSMPPAAGEGAPDDWYVSFDGEQEGPLPLARALDRVRVERPRGKECYCWRGGFFVWLPIEDVPEFAPALVKVPPPIPAVRPRPATGQQPALRSPTGKQPALRSPTGQQPALRSPTGQQPAVKSPTGQLPALRSPTGQQPAVRSPTGPQATIKSPTGKQPALRGPSGNMNVVKGPGDLPSMDSGPLGTPGALLPSLETKP
ncbi:MAG: zinc-ribbon domain-containing protein, partial [Polyangia bacterium]